MSDEEQCKAAYEKWSDSDDGWRTAKDVWRAAWQAARQPAAQPVDALDAARYRWLRDSGDSPRVIINGRWYGAQHRACLDLDAAIDAAMQNNA